ncbi:MAG TPA: PDZ domain-containing protein [Anaerolineae bacterium]|nr:PDZ domain-containing protein [Anaerolineae bacterium]
MRERMAVALILMLLFSASCTAIELNGSTMVGGLVAVIPFELYGSAIMVELTIDGSDALDFIFDTGAGGTILSARTAERLDITGDETVSRQGAAGDAPVVLSEKHTLTIGDLTLSDIALGIAGLDHIDRRFGVRIEGAIGWAILSQYAVRLNYDRMQIEVYDTRRYDYNLAAQAYDLEVSGTTLLIHAAVGFESGAVFTGRVIVDSGSTGSIFFNTPFAREKDLLSEIGSSYAREVIAGLSADSYQVVTTMLSSFTVGPYEFVDMPAKIAFAESGALSWPGIMGILGNNILKRFNLFIDVQQETIFLEPNQLYQEAFEFNCSGLELIMDENFERVIVDHVYETSPAEEAGLRVGDEILQIDGQSASDLQLMQIRSMLRQDGREVEILVSREGDQTNFLLRLRPLIGLENRRPSPL